MVLQVHQGRGVTLFTAKEVLIDAQHLRARAPRQLGDPLRNVGLVPALHGGAANLMSACQFTLTDPAVMRFKDFQAIGLCGPQRSEEHTSELQSLMRISYAVFCLKKKNTNS